MRRRPAEALRLDRSHLQRLRLLPHRLACVIEQVLDGSVVGRRVRVVRVVRVLGRVGLGIIVIGIIVIGNIVIGNIVVGVVRLDVVRFGFVGLWVRFVVDRCQQLVLTLSTAPWPVVTSSTGA